MKKLLCIIVLFSAPLSSQEKIDTAIISKIRDEGMNRSQAREILSWVADVYGPRLTGSPEYNASAQWATNKLSEWGLSNAHLESWGPFGRGWRLKKYSAMMIGKQNQPLVSYPKAWSPGWGNKEIESDVVYLNAETDSALETYKGKLKGKFVLFGTQSYIQANFKAQATRYTDSELLEMANAEPQRARGERFRREQTPEQKNRAMLTYKKWQLLIKENAVAVLTSAPTPRSEGGAVWVMGATVPTHPDTPFTSPYRIPSYKTKAPKIPPQVEIGNEHFNRLLRMIEKGEKVKIAMTLDVEWTSQKDDSSYNVIAEIPGTDLKDEVVMIGAHLDSWHGGTGATDNGTGVTACMEAMRILKSIGVQPRRTIRIALWGGEEQGLLGSRAYADQHFGKRDSLKPEAEKFAAYFNNDNGTGKVRGIYMQGNEELRSIFRAWLAPFKDLEASTLTLSNTGGTDHQSFDGIGLPGFQFIQDPIEYSTRTWHSTNDVLDRAQEEDMKQAAILMAAFAYNAAMRDEKLPRKTPAPRVAGVGYDEEWGCGYDHLHEH
ncbi:MAG: M20/M25/M40 family metallo-hydrolase [Ignavibacteriales bacterium]|nr:M20/M25/M40 family metallo-hydrolase [Ignavibacteriales bacterium]